MNKQLENQVRQILIKESEPGGLIYQLLEQNQKPTKTVPKIDPLEDLFSDVNAKLERVKELNEQKGRNNLLECALLREKETQQKYETTLLGLVSLVGRFGGDEGAMVNWNSEEFVKNAKPEEVIENVYQTLKEMEKDSEQRVAFNFADTLVCSAKLGKITIQDVIKYLKESYPEMNIQLLLDMKKTQR